jgi:hypothetical protein
MKNTVTRHEFIDSFKGGYAENFSYDGKLALFEYIEQVEEEMQIELELDPIGLCCEYNEYASLEEFHGNYNKEEYPNLEVLQEHTQIISISGTDGFIIQAF